MLKRAGNGFTPGATFLARIVTRVAARELAAQMLDKQVRNGRPARLKGLAEATGGPAFATCAGLVLFALNQRSEGQRQAFGPIEEPDGRFGRLGHWIRENI